MTAVPGIVTFLLVAAPLVTQPFVEVVLYFSLLERFELVAYIAQHPLLLGASFRQASGLAQVHVSVFQVYGLDTCAERLPGALKYVVTDTASVNTALSMAWADAALWPL